MLSSSQVLTATVVYAQSEELALAEEPIEADICSGRDNWIELDEWYADLKSGRWAIVSGEHGDGVIALANGGLHRKFSLKNSKGDRLRIRAGYQE